MPYESSSVKIEVYMQWWKDLQIIKAASSSTELMWRYITDRYNIPLDVSHTHTNCHVMPWISLTFGNLHIP